MSVRSHSAQKNALFALVTVKWGDSVMATRHLREGASAIVGAAEEALLPLPAEVLGVPALTFATVRKGAPIAFVPAGAVGFRERAGDVPRAVAGPSEITMTRGEVVSFSIGDFLLTVASEEDSSAPWALGGAFGSSLSSARYVAVAALAHAAFIGLSAHAAEAKATEYEPEDNEALSRYLAAADARSAADDKTTSADGAGMQGRDVNGQAGNGKDGGGEKAAGQEGSMGTTASRSNSASHYAVSGKNDPGPTTTIAATRDEVLEQARSFGLNTLLADGTHAPIRTFGEAFASADPFAASGAMWGSNVGETYGAGGLGLTGVGEGGGGNAIGSIGLGTIGTLGHTFGDPGLGTGGAGMMRMGMSGWGWGGSYSCGDPIGIGRIGTIGRVGYNTPDIYDLNPAPKKAAADDEARLPAETIRRIVRLASGRFRACYEPSLTKTPDLKGGVTTRFLIGANGGVKSAQILGTDLPQDIGTCVVRVFGSLTFPEPPDARPVTVTYPLTFTPNKAQGPKVVVER
ncbi:MAG: AgmX/PglI C-terminal domain-containing protein [Polyangiaceae bacterium]